MAKINWGITSGFVGKLGNVVGFNWKGQNVQRSHTVNGRKSQTKEQSLQRARFALITHAAGDLYEAIYAGFRAEARNRRTTQNGLFVRENIQNVIGDAPELLSLDYEHLKLSFGKLPGVELADVAVTGNVLSASIEEANMDDHRASEKDHVYLVAYCPEVNNSKCMAVGKRNEEGELSLTMSAKWAGKRIYAYAFVIGGASYNEGVASQTEYLGAFGAEAPGREEGNGGEQNNGGNSGTQSGGNTSGDTSNVVTVNAPVISGTTPFDESTQVTISGPNGAEIRYTTDGSTPNASSSLYNGAITLTSSATVKAIAIKDGVSSSVATKSFTKNASDEEEGGGNAETVEAPVISGNTSFTDSTEVTITGPAGAEIYYTTDGYVPKASSPLYTEPFTITGTTNVRAIAIKDGVSSQAVSRMFNKITGGNDEPVDTE